ncbi:uncharacterized protein A4U43_C07F3280 [Asparagus officinalis]|uniref:Uncharacterized protein n=1 Tax=Asparagus officinalis TaxID=4686 RepID=A0A5P1EE81_ASPOF|nr:uncharacterized protein LOC109848689 [Asparagus officinalis]ONK62380.1 uncharacterized protein A4U43_C07F3280 [Asparagus officinalis]
MNSDLDKRFDAHDEQGDNEWNPVLQRARLRKTVPRCSDDLSELLTRENDNLAKLPPPTSQNVSQIDLDLELKLPCGPQPSFNWLFNDPDDKNTDEEMVDLSLSLVGNCITPELSSEGIQEKTAPRFDSEASTNPVHLSSKAVEGGSGDWTLVRSQEHHKVKDTHNKFESTCGNEVEKTCNRFVIDLNFLPVDCDDGCRTPTDSRKPFEENEILTRVEPELISPNHCVDTRDQDNLLGKSSSLSKDVAANSVLIAEFIKPEQKGLNFAKDVTGIDGLESEASQSNRPAIIDALSEHDFKAAAVMNGNASTSQKVIIDEVDVAFYGNESGSSQHLVGKEIIEQVSRNDEWGTSHHDYGELNNTEIEYQGREIRERRQEVELHGTKHENSILTSVSTIMLESIQKLEGCDEMRKSEVTMSDNVQPSSLNTSTTSRNWPSKATETKSGFSRNTIKATDKGTKECWDTSITSENKLLKATETKSGVSKLTIESAEEGNRKQCQGASMTSKNRPLKATETKSGFDRDSIQATENSSTKHRQVASITFKKRVDSPKESLSPGLDCSDSLSAEGEGFNPTKLVNRVESPNKPTSKQKTSGHKRPIAAMTDDDAAAKALKHAQKNAARRRRRSQRRAQLRESRPSNQRELRIREPKRDPELCVSTLEHKPRVYEPKATETKPSFSKDTVGSTEKGNTKELQGASISFKNWLLKSTEGKPGSSEDTIAAADKGKTEEGRRASITTTKNRPLKAIETKSGFSKVTPEATEKGTVEEVWRASVTSKSRPLEATETQSCSSRDTTEATEKGNTNSGLDEDIIKETEESDIKQQGWGNLETKSSFNKEPSEATKKHRNEDGRKMNSANRHEGPCKRSRIIRLNAVSNKSSSQEEEKQNHGHIIKLNTVSNSSCSSSIQTRGKIIKLNSVSDKSFRDGKLSQQPHKHAKISKRANQSGMQRSDYTWVRKDENMSGDTLPNNQELLLPESFQEHIDSMPSSQRKLLNTGEGQIVSSSSQMNDHIMRKVSPSGKHTVRNNPDFQMPQAHEGRVVFRVSPVLPQFSVDRQGTEREPTNTIQNDATNYCSFRSSPRYLHSTDSVMYVPMLDNAQEINEISNPVVLQYSMPFPTIERDVNKKRLHFDPQQNEEDNHDAQQTNAVAVAGERRRDVWNYPQTVHDESSNKPYYGVQSAPQRYVLYGPSLQQSLLEEGISDKNIRSQLGDASDGDPTFSGEISKETLGAEFYDNTRAFRGSVKKRLGPRVNTSNRGRGASSNRGRCGKGGRGRRGGRSGRFLGQKECCDPEFSDTKVKRRKYTPIYYDC